MAAEAEGWEVGGRGRAGNITPTCLFVHCTLSSCCLGSMFHCYVSTAKLVLGAQSHHSLGSCPAARSLPRCQLFFGLPSISPHHMLLVP